MPAPAAPPSAAGGPVLSQPGDSPAAPRSNQRGLLAAWAAQQAGFTGKALVDWTALALAESGGDPHQHNGNAGTGDDSYGLWQINYYGNLRPGRTASYGPPEGLYDPVKNAQAAYDLSGGGVNYSPWQADFNNGAFYRNRPDALAAVAALNGGALPDTSGTSSSGGQLPPGSPTPVGAGDKTGFLTGDGAVWKVSYLGTILTKPQARALVGGGAMIAGTLILLGGVAVIVASTFGGSPLSAIPGVGLVAKGAGRAAPATDKPPADGGGLTELDEFDLDQGRKTRLAAHDDAVKRARAHRRDERQRPSAMTDAERAQYRKEGFGGEGAA